MAKTVSVRVPEDLFLALSQRAKLEGKKVSDVMRELVELGLKVDAPLENGNTAVSDNALMAKMERLEETVRRLIGQDQTFVMSRLDALNADIWEGNRALLAYIANAGTQAAEARYLSRMAAIWIQDVAHFVSQKVDLGVVPTPPDKHAQTLLWEHYENRCKDYSRAVISQVLANEEPAEQKTTQ